MSNSIENVSLRKEKENYYCSSPCPKAQIKTVNSAPSLRRVLYINLAINPCPDNSTNIAVRYQNGYSLETKIANLNQFGASFQHIA